MLQPKEFADHLTNQQILSAADSYPPQSACQSLQGGDTVHRKGAKQAFEIWTNAICNKNNLQFLQIHSICLQIFSIIRQFLAVY